MAANDTTWWRRWSDLQIWLDFLLGAPYVRSFDFPHRIVLRGSRTPLRVRWRGWGWWSAGGERRWFSGPTTTHLLVTPEQPVELTCWNLFGSSRTVVSAPATHDAPPTPEVTAPCLPQPKVNLGPLPAAPSIVTLVRIRRPGIQLPRWNRRVRVHLRVPLPRIPFHQEDNP